MSSMNEMITDMFQAHKLKFHPFDYTTHELQQALNHIRRTLQTKMRDDLKIYLDSFLYF